MKKTGTDEHIPKIKKGFIKTMNSEYGVSKEKAEEIVESFIKVIIDASDYLFSLNHSQSYSYIGYICGYLRYYYPLEFLSVMLNINKGNIEKTASIIEYAKTENIKIFEAKFRYSKAEYFPDKDTRTIYKGIESIKFLNSQVAEYMYSLKDNEYNTFTELLIDIQGHMNSRQLEILITLDFFEEFGKSNKLMRIAENFNSYYGKKQLKKDKVPSEVSLFAKKETEKQYREVDTLELCKYLEDTIKDTHLPIQERVKCRVENTGSCSLTTTEYPKNVCIVIEIDTKYTPRVKLYSLHTGRTQDFKISKKMFSVKHFENFSLIEVKKTKQEHRRKRVEDGIDQKGKVKYKYIQTEEIDMYLDNYSILTIN